MLTREKPRESSMIRLKPDVKKAVEAFAKSRGVSFSRAAEYVLEQFVKAGCSDRKN